MEFIISELKTEQDFKGVVLGDLRKILSNIEGFCFFNHPFIEENTYDIDIPSFLVASPNFGFIILDAYSLTIDNITKIDSTKWYVRNWDKSEIELIDNGEDKIYAVYSQIGKNRTLRKFSEKDERLKGQYLIYLPYVFENEWKKKFGEEFISSVVFKDTIQELFMKITQTKESLPKDIWNEFLKILTGFTTILKKPLRKVEDKKTKAWIIRKVEEQIQSLDVDEEQIKIGQQISPGPQRIRGLAGTGKTIILTMKAAFMHYKHPEWDIVYTFNTQSLYDFIQSLIERFYRYFSGGREPDWNKLRILHGWGGRKKEGLYSYVSKLVGIKPLTFSEAKSFYEHKRNIELLGKVCMNLIQDNDVPELFDAILIDEAQDFHKGFFQFSYKVLKKPKRLIWAYDELQSLEDVSIPTAKDIFGIRSDGIPVVDLDGFYTGRIEKDFVLCKTYRNPRIILMLAHFFGMGIFRRRGAIQFVPKVEAWEDLGYKIINGTFEVNKEVVITRPKENSPNQIEDFVGRPQELVTVKTFNNKKEELNWLAEQIYNDIQADQLLPEDILIIGLNKKDLFEQFEYLKSVLQAKGINSFVIGKDFGRDTFRVPNYITLSTVFKAKGNEANRIYIFNFENSEIEDSIIQSRNMAFTSITRSKGWVTITGTGNVMKELENEIFIILENYPNIRFKVPDINKIKRYLDNIEYEKRRLRIKKSEQKLKEALKFIAKLKGEGELSPDTLEQMEKAIERAKKGKDK